MATPASSSLMDKMREYRQRKERDYASLAASIPAAVVAGQQGGMPAAIATASKFYAKPDDDRIGKADKAALKADIIKLLNQADSERQKNRLAAAKDVTARAKEDNDLIVKMVEAAQRAGTGQAQADANVISSVNSALASIDGNFKDYLGKVLQTTNPGTMGAINGALTDIQIAMKTAASGGGMADAGAVDAIAGAINMMVANGNVAELAALKAAGDQLAKQFGAGSLDEWLYRQTSIPGATGEQAMSAYSAVINPQITGESSRLADLATDLAHADKLAQSSKLVRGTSNSNKKAGEFFDMMAERVGLQLGEDGAPKTADDLGAEIDSLLGDPDPASQEKALKLLDELDKEDLPPASNLAEAKRQIMASDDFKKFMSDNGFQDAGMAFKELRKMTGQNVFRAKQADRALIRQRRLGHVDAETDNSGPDPTSIPEAERASTSKPTLKMGLASMARGVTTAPATIGQAEVGLRQAVGAALKKRKEKRQGVTGEVETP